MEMEPAICSNPGVVTAEWLTSVLRYAGYDCQVDSFNKENVGTGQVGQNIRFNLGYSAGAGPSSIVGKFASDDLVSRQTGIERHNYFNEVRFYQELQPTLDVQTPRVLFTGIDTQNHDFVLMMEDLSPAVQGDQLAGCSPTEAELALGELAKLHGPRWGDPTLYSISWLSGQTETSGGDLQQLWQAVWPGFVARYQQLLSARHMAIAEQLGNCLTVYTRPYQGEFTVTHGDYRLDNMLFGGPYPLAVVDWQTPKLGVGAADAAYFMGTGMVPELRRVHERGLLTGYHRILLSYGVSNYSVDQCWQDYRHFAFGGLIMAVIASMIVGQSARGDRMFMAMASRSAQMALDLGSDEFLG
jgi:hypothetical protein